MELRDARREGGDGQRVCDVAKRTGGRAEVAATSGLRSRTDVDSSTETVMTRLEEHRALPGRASAREVWERGRGEEAGSP